jgi:hypothetical protein
MKKLFTFLLIAFSSLTASAQSYEYKVITIVESIVPMGVGRSRMIEAKQPLDAKQFTTARTDGKESKQGDIERSDLKLDNFDETKLLNFYSAAGINFQNIASNDALITSKINALTSEGWELAFVSSGVESDAGGPDGKGIYITRLMFKKRK